MTPTSIHRRMRVPLNKGGANAVKARPGLRGGSLFGSARCAAGTAKKAEFLRRSFETPSKPFRSPFVTSRLQHAANTVTIPSHFGVSKTPECKRGLRGVACADLA